MVWTLVVAQFYAYRTGKIDSKYFVEADCGGVQLCLSSSDGVCFLTDRKLKPQWYYVFVRNENGEVYTSFKGHIAIFKEVHYDDCWGDAAS